ncbi:hypothetical protein SVIOM74S_00494 [Streptomyces violarus]
MQNLAGRVHLSQSALSRLIARLEKDGLVTRSVCVEDRRGVWVALTSKGRDLHAEALPLQRAATGPDPGRVDRAGPGSGRLGTTGGPAGCVLPPR